MKILHVASFCGNIGDIANHHGFRGWFEPLLYEKIEWYEFEIRDVYRKTSAFDEHFVFLANQVDLVVVGGGNFFEMWVDSSPTGTSISIEKDYLDKIQTPIFFNALGVDDAMGASESNIYKFNNFFRTIINSNQFLVSVRNDGALEVLKEHIYDHTMLRRVIYLPDGGFFTKFTTRNAINSGRGYPVIGINLAGDMLDTRFPGGSGIHNYESFLDEFIRLIGKIWKKWPEVRFVFFPHIYSDVKVFADLMSLLPDILRRNHIRMAAYDANSTADNTIFSEYVECNTVLSMRFHANVVAIANNVPSIGLYSYKQIRCLFAELQLEKYLVDVKKYGFHKEIYCLIEQIIEQNVDVSLALKQTKTEIEIFRKQAEVKIRDWLDSHNFKTTTCLSVLQV